MRKKRTKQEIAIAIFDSMMSSFQSVDQNIPIEDETILEKLFCDGKISLGEEVTLSNSHKYKCMAAGWKRL